MKRSRSKWPTGGHHFTFLPTPTTNTGRSCTKARSIDPKRCALSPTRATLLFSLRASQTFKPNTPTPLLGACWCHSNPSLVRGWQGCVRSRGGCALRICPRHGVRRGVAQAGGRACDVEPLFWVGNHGVRKRTRTETKNMLTLLMTTTHTPCCAGAFLRSRVRRVLISSEPLCA